MPSSNSLTRSTRPGRPPVHDEEWTNTSVVLFNREIVFLDRLSSDIRASSGTVVRRAEIIRALIDGLEKSRLDVSRLRSADDLKFSISQSR